MENVLDINRSLDSGELIVAKSDIGDDSLLDKAMQMIIELKRSLTIDEADLIFGGK